MEREIELFKTIINQNEKQINERINRNNKKKSKSIKLSETSRAAGDKLLDQSNEHNQHAYFLAFKKYCKSILLAPKDSKQLGLGYQSRSALLFQISKYKDCIKDIDCALNIPQTCTLDRVELLRRKAECLEKLGIFEKDSITEEVESLIDIIDDADKEAFINLINESMVFTIKKSNKLFGDKNSFEIKNVFDCIEVKCNDEFGKHLVAADNFELGDTIFVEKPYSIYTSPTTTFTHCNFCLKTAWSGIPCEFCTWSIYCSKECKEKAYELHHSHECTIFSFVNCLDRFCYIKLCFRTVIIAIKQARSIAELRKKIDLHESSEPTLKGFSSDGKYCGELIDSMYSFDSKHYKINKLLEAESIKIMELLKAVVQHTKLIENVSFDSIDDCLKNEDLIFIGSLMLKLSIVSRNNHYMLSNKIKACDFGNDYYLCENILCCSKGMCLTPLSNLMQRDSLPNAIRCCVENNEIKVFAVQPIKKGDQITVSHTCRFCAITAEYKERLLKEYNTDDFFHQPSSRKIWTTIFKGLINLEENVPYDYSDILDIFLKYMVITDVRRNFEKQDIEMLSTAITNLIGKSSEANKSCIMYLLVQSLEMVITNVYGTKNLWNKWNNFDQNALKQ